MYLFYLDESGEREYESSSRYFVLCAVGIRTKDWKAINTDILALKKTYFGTVDVEIKSNWLRIPKERERRYRVPFGISDTELREFTDKLYDILQAYDTVIIAAVVDKKAMSQQYNQPQAPSSLAYRLVLERIELFLQRNTERMNGIVIYDKITELKIKKKGYENLLYRQHLRYLEKGTDFVQVNQIVEGLLFISSHENNLLQVPDLCAYNIYRQFREFGEEWHAAEHFEHRYEYFKRIEPYLHRSDKGHYAGYGIKKFP